MVLEIRLENFFSIDKELILELRAGNINSKKSRELALNAFDWEKNKVLKTLALYGANASGKSNIIKAIRFCCEMVLDSHGYNENTVYDFERFKFNSPKKASSFLIRFVSNDIEYEYSFCLTKTEIITESLYHYPRGRKARIFERDERKGNSKRDKYSFSNEIKRPFDVADNTSNKTLYLSRASQMDRTIGKEIFNFFSEKFILRYRYGKKFYSGWPLYNLNNEKLLNLSKKFLLAALQIADSDIIDIVFKKKKGYIEYFPETEEITELIMIEEEELMIDEEIEIRTYHKSAPNIPFNFFKEESDGTQKLFFIFLNIIDAIQNDKLFLIDEIETHLHTKIAKFIIDLFHQNPKSQLIFSTHNTNLLDLNRFRRDQIYFVNKNEKGASDLYSLYDFKDFRENMDLEKAYLQGRFGATPIINDSELKDLVDGIKASVDE